jgi:hypothetical protein
MLCLALAQVDSNLLEHWDLPQDGPIFKSLSGELSNLRWDLPVSEMPAYFSKPNRKHNSGDWQLLADLTKGLAGGSGSRYVCIVVLLLTSDQDFVWWNWRVLWR